MMDKQNEITAGEMAAGLSRREFLQVSGAGGLSLSLAGLGGTLSSSFVGDVFAAATTVDYQNSESVYRDLWSWDAVTWGSHSNACMPGSCAFRVYVKDGIIWREEQVARADASNENYPDYNPLGCQKGCSFSNNIYGEERVKYPLRRVGERGEGKWERISWDEALTAVAESIVDSFAEKGSDGFVLDAPHMHIGGVAWAGVHRMTALLGSPCPDLNVEIGDFYKGMFDTIGKMHTGYSCDNMMDADVLIMTHTNWSYTMTPVYHFIVEARYAGKEVIWLSPDYNPSAVAADIHVPLKVGTDAAFWLGVCNVIVAERSYDEAFMREQTDMAMLVRKDNGRFLRADEYLGEGREDQLFFYDTKAGAVVPAPRGTLAFDGEQALEGSFEVTLASGETVTVEPSFEQLKRRLLDYTPEKAGEMCGVHPGLIEEIARKVATKVVCSYIGLNSAKNYHGDLQERSLLMAMGLTGNWGKPGTGWNGWALPIEHVELLTILQKPVAEGGLEMFGQMEHQLAEQLRAEDPEITEELISVRAVQGMTKMLGMVPPVFWLYNHCGFKELYDNDAWQDPEQKQSFSAYMEEAIKEGWWTPDQIRPSPDLTPDVLLLISHNPLRRIRGGAIKYPQELFPKLKMIWAVEVRMSSSAMFADIVLPAAWYYEKEDMPYAASQMPRYALIEQAAKPQGEALPEWEIWDALTQKLEEVAASKGYTEYGDFFGQQRQWAGLNDRFTMNGHLKTHSDCVKEMVAIGVATGGMPPDLTYEKAKEIGHFPVQSFGQGFMKHIVANDHSPDKPFYSLKWHLTKKLPYPTYTRRAQFYLDHPWYIEAGEHMPMFKPTPKIGGDHPFQITGGHPRHSVHSMHLTEKSMMRLHRGQPVIHINDRDAMELGISNGDMVRLWNDYSDSELMAKISPQVQPKQVIVYVWESYQFKGWKVYDRLLVGLPKALHFAGGYEQFRYYMFNGSPAPSTDRGVRASIAKV